MSVEKAVFAAGCFWGVEEKFRKVKGVIDTRVGYTGGHAENPSYEDVCSGNTGHCEAVEVTFDSSKVKFKDLVEFFFSLHDPTYSGSRHDESGQYRSAIFYGSEKQRETALSELKTLESRIGKPVKTQVVALGAFFEAEEYHQCYLEKKKKIPFLERFFK